MKEIDLIRLINVPIKQIKKIYIYRIVVMVSLR